jgi:tRNA(Ile)-lysidine synthase
MRLLRGAGVAGLSAIPPVRENIIRPLIEVTREEVLEYLQSSGLEYVSDPSNTKPVYPRNRIRMEVLPVLKQFNPRIVETLASEAALLRDEGEAAEACLSTIAAGMIVQEGDGVALKREEFNALPQAFKRRMFRRAVDLAGAESSGLSSVQINDAIAFMAAAQTGRTMHMPYGLIIEREYKKFVIRLQAAAERFSYTLAVPGITLIPELGLEVETLIRDRENESENPPSFPPLAKGAGGGFEASLAANNFWQALFDYDKIRPLVTIRNRRSGDRFCPAGMGGKSKKLQDYFVDEKIPRQRRDRVPILLSGHDVLWVVGLRTDNRFLPGKGTKSVLGVQVRSKKRQEQGPENEAATRGSGVKGQGFPKQ